jgi:hypothetical protein
MSSEIYNLIGALAGLVTIIIGLNALVKWIKSHRLEIKNWLTNIHVIKRKDKPTIIPFPRHHRK